MAEFKRLGETDLGDRYKIKGVLGEGGLGVVYEAYDTILKIDVAIKTLQSDRDGQALVRLQREAMAAGKLKNNNIARVYNFGQTELDSLPYMVMELVDGISLSDFIHGQDKGRLDYKIAVPIFEQICIGLEHAHNNGIIHRDLKPSNVMLIENFDSKYSDYKFVVKLLDFGVAKIEADQSLTTNGAVLGSPLYMSPEQAQGTEVKAQSDFYSLGCLMFETLTGRVPIQGDSPLETMRMHRQTAPPLVADIVSDDSVPKALVELVDQCLRKQIFDRPESARSIKKSLEQIMGRNMVQAQLLDTPIKRKPSPIKLPDWSHKTVFKLACGASILGVGVLILMYQHFQNTSLSKNVKLDDSITKKEAEPMSRDLSKLVGKSDCFEFITAHREQTVETKKDTVDDDFVDLENTYFTALKIKDSNVKGSGFKYISKIPLHKVELRSDSIEPIYFAELLKIKNLSSLRVDSNKADSLMMNQIVQFKNLEQLTLDSNLLEDKDFAVLAGLPKLKKVKVSGNKLTDNLIDQLTKIKKLETLDLEHCKLMTENLGTKLAKIKTLKSLNLPCNQSVKSLVAISKLGLEDLDVGGLEFSSSEFEVLCSMKKLKTLHMSNIRLKAADYVKLNKLSNLEELDLSSEKICSPALFATLASLPVKRIDLSKSDINGPELNMLIDNKNLNAVDLHSCKKIEKLQDDFKRIYQKRWQKNLELDFEQSDEKQLDKFNINPNVFDVPR